MPRVGQTGVKGLDRVIANLNKAITEIKDKSTEGLIEAGIFIRRETETQPPLTPVDLGNLRASWFMVVTKKGVKEGGKSKFKGKKGGEYAQIHHAALEEAKTMLYRTNNPTAIMGYSMNYAAPVHEMMGANFKRPGAGPKWFEYHLHQNTKKIVDIVRRKIKGI